MFYAITHPDEETDRIRLHPRIEDAIAEARDDRRVYEVALHFDEGCRLLMPCWLNPWAFDPDWTTRAEVHGDGSLTAKGPIPKELFVECVPARP